ncbi:MAG: hypothetical protein DRP55_01650 [Spirochaetes bacterium]|nr:amidohydrolase family protein [Deltaproteobacteria bacterium]RKY03323.1 MAG: hypothetical protein DRP55_01650 [Spirochaetota bacterium]
MKRNLLITNAIIDDKKQDILIEKGKIVRVGRISSSSGIHLLDANGKIVLPGFVNIHTHLDKADLISRMKPEEFGGTLEQNRELIKKFKKNYTKKDIKDRAKRVITEMVAMGITAIRTHVDVDPICGLLPMEALLELQEEIDIVELHLVAFPQQGVLSNEKRDLVDKAVSLGANLVGGLPLVEHDRDGWRKHIDLIFDIAAKYNKDIEVQIDESNDPDDFALPLLVEKTLEAKFYGRVTATHVISLSKIEAKEAKEIIAAMKEAGIKVIVTPSANLITRFPNDKKVWGYNSITRIKDLIDAGIEVAIGTDNIRDPFFPFGNGSMIREIHTLIVATRMTTPNDIEEVFKMATINGAKMMGLNYGISEGKKGDMVIFDTDTLIGILNSPEKINYVIKDGEIIYGRDERK